MKMYYYSVQPQVSHGYPGGYWGFQTPRYYSGQWSYPSYRRNPSGITKSALELSNTIRKLWEQHTVWTRATIVSLVFDLPDASFVTNRLLQNPVDFGNLFSIYYGDRAGTKLSDLLRDHLVIAAELVKAAKAGDNEAAAEIEKRWYTNGDQIAAFLGSINLYWSEEVWRRMIRMHLDLVKTEAVTLITGNYQEEGSIYDQLETQALEMADVMTQGIIRQFPARFR